MNEDFRDCTIVAWMSYRRFLSCTKKKRVFRRMESLFMLFMYGVYCVALSYNARLERWAKSYNIPFLPKDDEPAEESALVSYRSLQEDRLSYTGPSSPTDQYKEQEGKRRLSNTYEIRISNLFWFL